MIYHLHSLKSIVTIESIFIEKTIFALLQVEVNSVYTSVDEKL